jgi:hypothetical protein
MNMKPEEYVRPKSRTVEEIQWLEHTQQMRVVALDEALKYSENRGGMHYVDTLRIAAAFSAFLIEGIY